MNQMYPARITLSRATTIADSARNYKVLIDNRDVGKIETGKTIEIPMAPGNHTIVLKIDWCGSNRIPFSINPGENLQFECGSSLTGWKIFVKILYVLFMPNEYLWIRKL